MKSVKNSAMSEKQEDRSELIAIMCDQKSTNGSLEKCGSYSFPKTELQSCPGDISKNSHSLNDINNGQIPTDNTEIEDDKSFKFFKIDNRKKTVLCLCISANFFAGVAYGVLGPFFPMEARTKGMDLTMIGFVFGVYQLVVFLTTPIMANFMTRVGIKFMFTSGIFVGGCSAILFGILDKGPGGPSFLIMCILVRSVEAVGFAAFMTASMTVLTLEFPDHVGSTLSLVRGANGSGLLLGPIVAGFLYEMGGFGLPFYAVGVLILLNGGMIFKFLPTVQDERECHKREKTIKDLICSPNVVIYLVSLFLGAGGIMFFMSAFESFVEPFELSPPVTGAFFSIGPVTYALTTPIWGYITDKTKKCSKLIQFSHFMAFIGWGLLGLCPLIQALPFNMWTVSIGFALLGVSTGGLTVVTVKCLINESHELHFERGPDTNALVSGLFNSVFAFASFSWPLVGGALAQNFGFPRVFTGTGFIIFLMLLVTLWFFSIQNLVILVISRKRKESGKK